MTTAPPPTADLDHLADETGAITQHGDEARSRFDRILGRLPYLLSSKPVIISGIMTLIGHPAAVSANTQLILGNYTNVSSSVGAGIAAGASLTLIKRQRRAHRLAGAAHQAAEEASAVARETHRLLHLAHPDKAAELGQVPGELSAGRRPSSPGAGQ